MNGRGARLGGVTAVALAALGASFLASRSAAEPPSLAVSGPTVTGQWLWSARDAAEFTAARQSRPELVPAVFVANIDGEGAWHRRLSPSIVAGPVAVVVRIDDDFHAAFHAAERDVAKKLATPLAAVLAEVRATGASVLEVQLDYDAPVRLLAPWAAVVRELSRGPLAGTPVWVTTLPSHVASLDFHAAFAGTVAGHVIQLFDTGLPCTDGAVASLSRDLRAGAIAFRVGVGAFERGSGTDHGCWLDAAERLRRIPGFSGIWVFGAARRTAPVFERLARRQGDVP